MTFVNENGDFVLDWETTGATPFCFPISICKGILPNKDEIINSIEYKHFDNYNSPECYRSENLLNKHFCKPLIEQVIKNFIKANEVIYEYDLTNLTPYITGIWGNKYTKGQYISSHAHPNSWFSGVYYPYGTGTTELLFENPLGYMMIEPPRKKFNMYNSATWSFTFPEDTMIFFPSHLKHQTFRHQDEKEKISVGFNIFLKGILSEVTETYLTL